MTDKGMRQLVRDAGREGWSVEPTNGGHLRLSKPGLAPVFASRTPSDWRATRQVRSQMRRAERLKS